MNEYYGDGEMYNNKGYSIEVEKIRFIVRINVGGRKGKN